MARAAAARRAPLDVVGRESRYTAGLRPRRRGQPAPGRRRSPTTRAPRSPEADAWLVAELRKLQAALPAAGRGGADRPRPHRHRLALADRGDPPQGAPHLLDRRRPPAPQPAVPLHPVVRRVLPPAGGRRPRAARRRSRPRSRPGAGSRSAGSGSSRTSTCRPAKLLVRQALYGQRYFERTFGARHRAAWLPDTFGFSPALPQILKGAGLDHASSRSRSAGRRPTASRTAASGGRGSTASQAAGPAHDPPAGGQLQRHGRRRASLLRLWRNHADKAVAPARCCCRSASATAAAARPRR